MRLLVRAPGPFDGRKPPLTAGGSELLPLSMVVEFVDAVFRVDGDDARMPCVDDSLMKM